MRLEEWKRSAPGGSWEESDDGELIVSAYLIDDDETVASLWRLEDYRVTSSATRVLVLRPRERCACCGHWVGD